MSNLSSDKLKFLCPDSWVARTYGEYLAACSQDQADLISACTDAISSETLEQLIDNISTEYHDDYDFLNDVIQQELINRNAENPYSFTWNDPAVIEIFAYHYENDIEFKTHCDSFVANFPELNVSADELYEKLDIDEDSIILTRQDFLDSIDTIVASVCTDRQLPSDFQYTLNNGFVDFRQLLKGMIINSNLQLATDEFTIAAFNGRGTSIGNVTISTDEVIDEMKTNFASAVAWSYGFLSLASDNVSDAILTFEANIDTVISEAKEKFSSSVATVKATIAATKANAKDFIQQAGDMLGWNKVVDDFFTTVDETDVANYTGASPLSAINIHSAADVVSAVGNTLLAVGAGVWMAVKTIGEKVWAKAKPFVMALTNNPVDIAVCDDTDDSFTVSNFQFQATGRSQIKWSNNNIPYLTWYNMIHDMRDQSYSISTYFGELCVTPTFNTYYQTGVHEIEFKMIFRPKCLNYRALLSYGVAERIDVGTIKEKISFLNPDDPTSWSKYVSWINSGEIFADDDEDESYMFMGFIAATHMMLSVLGITIKDLNSQFYSEYGDKVLLYQNTTHRYSTDLSYSPDSIPVSWNSFTCGISRVVPNAVTNFGFLRVCSGYRTRPGDTSSSRHLFDCVNYYKANAQSEPATNDDVLSIQVLADYFLTMIMMQKYDRIQHPADFLYLPYSNSSYQFSSGRYRIKTDAENADVANALANIIITAVVILTAVIICKSVVKIFKKKKFMKLTARVGRLDNAMWNGKTLSKKEMRQYIRGQRKLQKMDYFSSGFAGSVTRTSSILTGVVGLTKTAAANSNIDVIKTITTGKIQQKQRDDSSYIAQLITG